MAKRKKAAVGAKGGETFTVSIPDHLMYPFESQSRQFPASGPLGLSHEHHEVRNYNAAGALVVSPVECLLWRNLGGELVGILYYYPDDAFEFDGSQLEAAGNVNVYIRSDWRGKGVGTKLGVEADKRWGPIDLAQQRYTTGGAALARAIERRRAE